MMTVGIVITIELVAAIVIALQSILRINRMTRRTHFSFFGAWAVMGGAAAACAASILAGRAAPDTYSAMLLVAVALIAVFDRRGAQ